MSALGDMIRGYEKQIEIYQKALEEIQKGEDPYFATYVAVKALDEGRKVFTPYGTIK